MKISRAVNNLNFSYRFYLYMGLIGAIIVGTGEYLLHFSPEGPKGEVEMLLTIPLNRARYGHYIAMFGIPFYFAGYYGILKLFKSSHVFYAKCLFICGILSFTYGGIWISSRYFAALVLQNFYNTVSYQPLLTAYEDNYQILVWVLRALILLVSYFYILCVVHNKVGLPKWLAIFNPIVLLGIIISTLFWAHPIGIYIAPIAMNTTHFILFALLLIYSKSSVGLRVNSC